MSGFGRDLSANGLLVCDYPGPRLPPCHFTGGLSILIPSSHRVYQTSCHNCSERIVGAQYHHRGAAIRVSAPKQSPKRP